LTASLKRRLLAGGSWVLAGKIITAASNVMISSLLARLLSTEDFGAFGLAFSLTTGGALLSQLGLQQAGVRLIAESMGRDQPGRARASVLFAYRHVVLGILVVAAILLLGGGSWLAIELWNAPALAGALAAVAAWMAVTSLQVLTSETFRGFKDLRFASLFGGVITGVLTLAVLIGLVVWQGQASVVRVVWISAGATAVSLLLGVTLVRRRIRVLPRVESITHREVFSISLPLWVSSVTTFALAQAALWILGTFLPKEDVGLYFAALRLVNLVSMPLVLVNLIVPPFIADLYARGEKDQLQRVVRATATIAGVPAFVVLATFLLFGGPIMALVFSEPYRAAAPLLGLLSIGYLVNVWTGSCGVTLSMTGHQTVLMRITLVSGIISVGGSLLVVNRFGTIGVATVVGATAVLQNLWMWGAARYHAGIWTHATIPSREEIRSVLSRTPDAPPSDRDGLSGPDS
jgi:O-antigen/teichoic acid export membrane protein